MVREVSMHEDNEETVSVYVQAPTTINNPGEEKKKTTTTAAAVREHQC